MSTRKQKRIARITATGVESRNKTNEPLMPSIARHISSCFVIFGLATVRFELMPCFVPFFIIVVFVFRIGVKGSTLVSKPCYENPCVKGITPPSPIPLFTLSTV